MKPDMDNAKKEPSIPTPDREESPWLEGFPGFGADRGQFPSAANPCRRPTVAVIRNEVTVSVSGLSRLSG